MLVLAIAYAISETRLIASIIGPILFRLVARQRNEPMRRLSKKLSDKESEMLLFVSFDRDAKPSSFDTHGINAIH